MARTTPAPENNKRSMTEQPVMFKKTGIVYEITTSACPVENCGMYEYTADYNGRIWKACYYCKVKCFIFLDDKNNVKRSGYSVMI